MDKRMHRRFPLVFSFACALALALGCGQPQPAFSRDAAMQRARESAGQSVPEVGILEARVDEVTAELISPQEMGRRMEADQGARSSSGRDEAASLWWVHVRGYFRFESMPAPESASPVYEAAERIFIYDARTGEELGSRITNTRLVPAPTPASSLPPGVKGYELYSWRGGGGWRFASLTGTNRNKTCEEVATAGDDRTKAPIPLTAVQNHGMLYGRRHCMEETKLTVRVPRKVLADAKRYARANETTVTRLVTQYLEHVSAQGHPIAEAPIVRRLSGTVSPHVGVEDYRRHLEEKYGGEA